MLTRRPFEEGVILKTRRDMDKMRSAGACVSNVLRRLSSEVKPGLPGSYLEELCRKILERDYASYRVEKSEDFPSYLSVSLNETAVHGVPSSARIRQGDLVTLDLALRIDGWFADSALTVAAGPVSPENMALLRAAREANEAGIAAVHGGGRLGDIGAAIAEFLATTGMRVVENLAGHGVGQSLHEAPTVLHRGERGIGAPIVPGMVFTVEPVVCLGRPEIERGEDGYCLRTTDGRPTALFEHTISVTSEGVECLTR